MATLNGVEFEIIEIEWSTYQNNVIQEILGSDAVEVQHQGFGSEPVRIKGMVHNEKEMDDFQEQFYSQGILTLIKDPDSGRQYSGYALGKVKKESPFNSDNGTGVVFTCMLQLRYPYAESIETINRSKQLTAQGQEWSSDDDGMDIKTSGNADAFPDIKITGGVSGDLVKDPGFETLIPWVYSEVDTNGSLSGAQDGTYEYKGNYCYRLKVNGSIQATDWSKIEQALSLIPIEKITFMLRWITGGASPSLRMKVYGGSQLLEVYDCPGSSQDTGWVKKELAISSSYQTLSFGLGSTVHLTGQDAECYIDNIVVYIKGPTKSPVVYNKANTALKCFVANDMHDGAVHRINTDGTGHIDFDEDFSSERYLDSISGSSGVTYSALNETVTLADNGYIYWYIDAKYIITEIPSLTSYVAIIQGIPTIQISLDGSTWYDIDDPVLHYTEKEYPLNSEGNLSLVGETAFYFRYDCVKAGVTRLWIEYFALDIDIHTIYARNPLILKGGASNTFRIDHDAASEMTCEVELIYKNRWWI